MSWTKLDPWTGPTQIGCLTCSPVPANVPLCRLDRLLAVGFGDVTVTKDGVCLYSELEWMQTHDRLDPLGMSDAQLEEALATHGEDLIPYPTLADFEAQAAADPDHDWRVRFWGMLHEEEYQRQGPEAWVLVRSAEGFA